MKKLILTLMFATISASWAKADVSEDLASFIGQNKFGKAFKLIEEKSQDLNWTRTFGRSKFNLLWLTLANQNSGGLSIEQIQLAEIIIAEAPEIVNSAMGKDNYPILFYALKRAHENYSQATLQRSHTMSEQEGHDLEMIPFLVRHGAKAQALLSLPKVTLTKMPLPKKAAPQRSVSLIEALMLDKSYYGVELLLVQQLNNQQEIRILAPTGNLEQVPLVDRVYTEIKQLMREPHTQNTILGLQSLENIALKCLQQKVDFSSSLYSDPDRKSLLEDMFFTLAEALRNHRAISDLSHAQTTILVIFNTAIDLDLVSSSQTLKLHGQSKSLLDWATEFKASALAQNMTEMGSKSAYAPYEVQSNLHYAIVINDLVAIDYALKNGARLNITNYNDPDMESRQNETPMAFIPSAVLQGANAEQLEDLIRHLMQKGFDPKPLGLTSLSERIQTAIDVLVSRMANSNGHKTKLLTLIGVSNWLHSNEFNELYLNTEAARFGHNFELVEIKQTPFVLFNQCSQLLH